MGVSWNGYTVVYSNSWLIYNGKPKEKLMIWGYPHLGKPPNMVTAVTSSKKKRASAKLCASNELSNWGPTLCQSVDGTMLGLAEWSYSRKPFWWFVVLLGLESFFLQCGKAQVPRMTRLHFEKHINIIIII